MQSKVYFSSLKNKKFMSPLNKLKKLLNKLDPKGNIEKGNLVAIKVHFGELGNTAFINPIYLRPILETVKSLGGKPYLTDTNTLYVGMRTNSIDHLHNAYLNGFNYSTLQVPIIIGDGLRGENSVNVPIDGELLKSVKLASDIINADCMIVVSHFKGHEVSGFGGAIKNISMGCASREGKLEMHSVTRPSVHEGKCTSCGRCLSACAHSAIIIKPKAFINENCTGCARCIAVCPENAIGINWDESVENTQMKMAEYASGVSKVFGGKILYINILTKISPACDCYPGNDEPITGDIGFLASNDPVAIDMASFDLVKKSMGIEVDPFKTVYTYIDSLIQLNHAQKIGLGSMDYNLVSVD